MCLCAFQLPYETLIFTDFTFLRRPPPYISFLHRKYSSWASKSTRQSSHSHVHCFPSLNSLAAEVEMIYSAHLGSIPMSSSVNCYLAFILMGSKAPELHHDGLCLSSLASPW